MKNFIVLTVGLLICLALPTALTAGSIIITKTNGGWLGYKTVKETHVGGGNLGNGGDRHRLECKDPGFESCEWQTSPTPGISTAQFNTMLFEVYTLIEAGSPSGSHSFVGGIVANWATEDDTITITFTIPE